ncbi:MULTISPECIES: recombinase family protein [Lactobacillaceae]|jgi:DNA invertase Pin-like site-specific DNA recombinase|uniref:Recombinase family protein n=1 Tax=Pediococcus acidilactici TaxID=1254 RepID=A0AAN5Y611_PEDAC|nr:MULTISPECIES: recombinase family protein [Pediococcus]APR29478.1 DNA invertase Pin [Pediococcus acidilactici]KAF0333325.1 helix-turn-helix domain-containing protein [Pediococcus acidilactici]KAF0339071.1 helix-turn-helix domain-containing protein [Pediococcus acidilactici]KAF0347983.1 helix-turn-helix domain-containing protein [Pediococcus acidilactici]KAF0351277.1 helix-turn-helix domain-containing protein [Pediococcus acidilactici]
MKIGYARVSTSDQNLDRQIVTLKNSGAQKIFEEKISGKNIERPQLKALLDYIHDDDVVTVLSLDRLGRNSKDLTEVIDQIRRKGAVLDVLDLPTFAGVEDGNLRALLTNLVLEIYKYTAEEERRKILSRQRQGIKIAKKKGIYKGRKKEYSPTGSKRFLYNGVVNGLKEGKSIAQISREVGIERIQVYRIRDYAKKINAL